ncbi:ABC-2 family transporter protein [Lutispora thermophila]|uniref:ABC-2 family transporter protein n=1 Tax=Lutispora thermophila TaxID=288966 RepID=UPI0038CC138F
MIRFVYTLIPFVGISVLFKRFNSIDNWNIYHLGVLYGIVGLAYNSSRMIGRAFDNFQKLILTGDLDVFYIRPHSIILQIFGSQFYL